MDDDATYLELYGEYVSLRDLGIATAICAASTFLFYYLALALAPIMRLGAAASGLTVTLAAVGSAVGFGIVLLLSRLGIIRVKRVVEEV